MNKCHFCQICDPGSTYESGGLRIVIAEWLGGLRPHASAQGFLICKVKDTLDNTKVYWIWESPVLNLTCCL